MNRSYRENNYTNTNNNTNNGFSNINCNNNNNNSSLIRNYPVVASQHHRRGHSFTTTTTTAADETALDLFSRTRRSVSLTPSEHSEVTMKLGKISVGSVKLPARNGLDDLLSASDGGKNDYDWLLTPPETPLCIERSDSQPSLAAPRKSSVGRSVSNTKPSRLSTSQMDSSYSSRPARSSSVTRSSVSLALNNYSSNRSSSILNTSSSSVSSYIRPSSPITRSSSTVTRPSTPSRSTPSRSSTPSKARSAPTVSSTDRARPSQSSRPSTPSSRTQAPPTLSFPTTRSSSRPSTPTRRNPVSTSSGGPSLSVSTSRIVSNGRSQTSTSRPSSPSPRIRTQQPVIPSDFPLDTPPNLRTSLPDRPISAGRSRPGASITSKANTESMTSGNLARRPSSPVMNRGRSVEPPGRGYLHANGHNTDVAEPRKSIYVSDSLRKSVKTSTPSENGGFGRTISKRSIDMAVRHMDIRNGSGNTRPLPNTSLFPQSVRSGPAKIQTGHASESPTSIQSNGSPSLGYNGSILDSSTYAKGLSEYVKKEENGRLLGRLADVDMYESTRYDAILLKEDLKNTTWLHSVDDKFDQISMFDNGFESLPEPFSHS